MPLPKLKKTLKHSWRFEAIGTQWELLTESRLSATHRAEIEQCIDEFAKAYSRFRADSIVASISKKAGAYKLPYAPPLFGLYSDLHELTDGAMSPLVGGTLEDIGYDATYSLKKKAIVRQTPTLDEVVRVDGDDIHVSQPVSIDVGAAGKGLLVDLLYDYLLANTTGAFVVDGSGDLRVCAADEVIGLEHPLKPDEIIGTVRVSAGALCASATNRRSWGGQTHIIDARTGEPVKGIIATWVIADTAMVADGLATALFFASPQVLSARYTYEYIRLHANGSVEFSDYFKEGLY